MVQAIREFESHRFRQPVKPAAANKAGEQEALPTHIG
jgi:hypothetical protein